MVPRSPDRNRSSHANSPHGILPRPGARSLDWMADLWIDEACKTNKLFVLMLGAVEEAPQVEGRANMRSAWSRVIAASLSLSLSN